MDPFLGPACFAPPASIPVREPASFVGQASFSGVLCVCNWLRRDAAVLLPEGLALAANRASPDLHPVVFMFGEQADGATIFGGMRFPVPVRYGEFGIAVPFVSTDSQQLYTFVPRMYSSYFPAVWHGNAHF